MKSNEREDSTYVYETCGIHSESDMKVSPYNSVTFVEDFHFMHTNQKLHAIIHSNLEMAVTQSVCLSGLR